MANYGAVTSLALLGPIAHSVYIANAPSTDINKKLTRRGGEDEEWEGRVLKFTNVGVWAAGTLALIGAYPFRSLVGFW
jgi:hypothetical protein